MSLFPWPFSIIELPESINIWGFCPHSRHIHLDFWLRSRIKKSESTGGTSERKHCKRCKSCSAAEQKVMRISPRFTKRCVVIFAYFNMDIIDIFRYLQIFYAYLYFVCLFFDLYSLLLLGKQVTKSLRIGSFCRDVYSQ